MVLNFLYIHDGKRGKITLNAEELDFTINYSQFNRWRPTAADSSCFGWLPIQDGGLRKTLPRYYGTVNNKATYNSLPSSLVSKINKFDGNNTYALDRSANFIDKDQLGHYKGIELYVQGDEGIKKVCNFMWAVLEEDDPQHPGQKILNSYYTGLYSFLCPNDGELPENSAVGNVSNLQGVQGKYSADLKIALWIITVHDDVSGSPTYGQDFKVLVEAFSQPEGFDEQGVIMADMRCLTGVDTPSNIINGSDPKKNSTPNGWAGNRNPYSEEVAPTKAPNALKNSVNSTTNGMHLYKLDNDQYNALTGLFWSDQFADMIDKQRFTPAMGVLSVHKLPYVPDPVGLTTTVHMCGRDLYTQDWKPFEGFSKDYFYGVPITGAQDYESVPIDVEPFFNSFLDFEPYTHVSIMLPFIGIVPISTNRVMGGSLKVNYILDNRNGNCVAQVFTKSMRNMQDEAADKWSLLGQWSGNTKMPMALFGNNNGASDVMNSVRGFASSAAGSVLMGVAGIAAPGVVATGIAASAISAGIGIASRQRPTQTISTIGTETACMSNLECRLIITRPVDVTPGHIETIDGVKIQIPDSLIEQAGLASCSGGTVNDYSGMTTGYIRGSIEGATEAEMLAIRNQFLGGVIV